MTGNCEQDAGEESSASEGETETVGKPTGNAPDTQNVWDITETVMEKSMMEEIPLNTLRHLSPERCEVTGNQATILGELFWNLGKDCGV